ncbi:efflux RND transporter periplasmic adaptor subunit [Sulfitobacter aestuarii]|uniref:Efflux RND transporter periplasmic adaptor subunit n=1 Tax=Sulfitobacter aestuarii TaxID=2161676 RepID=A0ABW5TYV9_9RHOB
MRIFSILSALAVTLLMYLAIFERPALLASFGVSPPPETGAREGVSEAALPGDVAAGGTRVKVMVLRSQAETLQNAVLLRGQTAAARQVDLRAETSAVVVSEPLRKGHEVARGETLCALDPGTRPAQLAEAQARLSEAEARVPESGARVAEAEARLKEAQINQNAAARLIQDGFASQTRVAEADAGVATAQAGLTSAEAGLRAARAGIEAARAAVAAAEKEITRLAITAPFSGVLESDSAELGSLLQPGALCATVLQLDSVKLVAFLPETEVHRVSLGAPAQAELAAGGGTLEGEVSFLARSADPQTRTFRVEIEVANPDQTIRDGQTVEIAIASSGVEAHLIPQSALTLNDEGRLGVRLIDAEAVVDFRPVELIRDAADGVWVAGLAEEIDLIVRGQEYVTAGVKVAPTWQELSQ